jgi:hypothetical protein
MGWVVAVLGADGSVVWVWRRAGFAPLREGSARRAPLLTSADDGGSAQATADRYMSQPIAEECAMVSRYRQASLG